MNLARAPRRQLGIGLLIVGLVLASMALVAPPADADDHGNGNGKGGQKYSEFTFVFENGTVFSGDTKGETSFNVDFPYVEGAKLHVSCSETYDDGWNSEGGFPNAIEHPDWKIASYEITRFRADGSVHFTCGETFTPNPEPVTVNVTVGYCVWDGEQSLTPINISISPAGGATVSVAGQTFMENASIDVGPGTYPWTATAAAGFELVGATEGEVVAPDCSPEPEPVTVTVVAGECRWDGQQSWTDVTIIIDPAGGAVVTLAGQDITGSGGMVPLPPGTYDWSATANPGYTLIGSASGSITAFDCEPEPEPVTVTVVAGECRWDGEQSWTDVTITIDPAGGAVVTLAGQDFTGTGGAVSLLPGSYDWSATANPGYTLIGQTGGTIEAIDCEVPPPTVTVTVVPGACFWDGQAALADIQFTIDPAGGATIALAGGGLVVDVTESGTMSVAPGDYTWTATANDPYVLTGVSNGAFTVEDCEPLRGAIGDYVWEDLDGDGLQDAGEPGIPGVEVNLWVDGSVIDTTTTGAGGDYLFDELLPGDYSVEFIPPAGFAFTTPDAGDDAADSDVAGGPVGVNLSEGEVDLTIDAGLVRPAFIVVEKLTDPVADGTFGFTGDIVADLAHGESETLEVAPGTYSVAEVVPDGWALVDVTCTAGGSGSADSAVAEYVVQSGETVKCTFTNTNQGTLVIEKATDPDSTEVFSFDVSGTIYEVAAGESVNIDLPAGEYTVTELVVDGWELASLVCSGESTTDLAAGTATLVVPPGSSVGCTFVNSQSEEPLGVIGDFAWTDQDTDGVQDAGEAPVSGVGVELLDADGTVMASTATNDAGIYLFANVPAGDYQVRFTAPADYLFTDADKGGDEALDSDVVTVTDTGDTATNAVGVTATFTLAEGEVNTDVDAGLFFVQVQSQNPEPEPKTPATPEEPTGPTASAEGDTQVLGIQELPNTGLSQEGWAQLALAIVLMGLGLVLIAGDDRKWRFRLGD